MLPRYLLLMLSALLVFSSVGSAQEEGNNNVEEESTPSVERAAQQVLEEQTAIDIDTASVISPERMRLMNSVRERLLETKLAEPQVNLTLTETARKVIERIVFSEPEIMPEQIPSLLFTNRELNLIDNISQGVVANAATQSEIRDAQDIAGPRKSVERGPRELSLAGILYVSDKDWIIWLNGQKMTPTRLTPEILDIDVSKDSIKIKWFDEYTNQIFPIKLKTHQRFNIDSRIFLPG